MASDPLTALISATVRAWANVTRASIKGAEAIMLTVLDAPAVESNQLGFDEETVPVPAQPVPTVVRPGDFVNADGRQLPKDAIHLHVVRPGGLLDAAGRRLPEDVDRLELPAEIATDVRVSVTPPPNTPSGTYWGSLIDASGRPILDEIGVYVVGDRPPP